ncbi:MAG: phosphoribosylamine--glycine ligase [Promethearchaeota archaeon]
MVNVVLVGNGAREHAIAEALVEGGATLRAFMSANNPGINKLAGGRVKVAALNDFKSLGEFARGCDFAVVGPEAPLVVGIADALNSAGIQCVGPTIENAQIEGSKTFTRTLLDKYSVPGNIKFRAFKSMDGLGEFVDELGPGNLVVKPDGLTGGKGVKVAGEHLHSREEVLSYCREIFDSRGRVVVEEKLEGEEFTLQAFVDGTHVTGTPLVQDHKRAYENDEGPNTGGMGSYSMADHLMPFVPASDVEFALDVMRKTVAAIKEENGKPYKGFLYGQFMKTPAGVKLVEYNARFGDPEAMNVLPIMETNFVDVCERILDGQLPAKAKFQQKATVVKYLAPEGYPTNPAAGEPIEVNEAALRLAGARYYFASVNAEGGKIFTSRSRTMGILGVADTLEGAEKIAEAGVGSVRGKLFHRSDVGTRSLLQKRIDHMRALLGE